MAVTLFTVILYTVSPKNTSLAYIFNDNLKNTKLYNINIYKDKLPGLKNILGLNGGINCILPFRLNIFFKLGNVSEALYGIGVKSLVFDPATFYVFNVFYFVNIFYLKKFIENFIKKFEKHFLNHKNELIGLDCIMKVDGCRLQSSAYSDTTAVTSCSRHSKYT